MQKSKTPSSKAMLAIWSGTIFFLLGYFPMMLLARPGFSVLAAAIGAIPYGMRLCSGLRGLFHGLWLGAIAGLALFLALTHMHNINDMSLTAASATSTAATSATDPASTAPAENTASSSPASAPATQPAGKFGRFQSPTRQDSLQLLGLCIATQIVVCSAICSAAGWLAKRRKKFIDRQWESQKDD